MAISYKKLWKLLIDREMKKKDLMGMAGISWSTITKMGHDEHVSTDILVKICSALNVTLMKLWRLCLIKMRNNVEA